MLRPAFILIFLAVLISAGVHAQILECVDSQGRKEFAASCPPGTISQKELRARNAIQQGTAGEAQQQDWQEQERAFQQRRLQRESAQADADKKQKQQEYVERRCANVQRQLEQLQSGRRLRWVDKTTGERSVMTDAEHATEMRAVQEELRRCRS